MHKMPSLEPGTVVEWQLLHRTVRLMFAEQLVNREIRFRTYAMCAAGEEPASATVVGIREYRARSNGFDRAFLVVDAHSEYPYLLHWNRIVEVIV